jgi:signal transduction histidine kinase
MIAQVDGQRVPVYITSVPLRDGQGALQRAVAVIRDLRQLREVERLKSDFVALVSHELRTPLTAIKGASQTVLRRVIPAEPDFRYPASSGRRSIVHWTTERIEP